jgi:hypothetical protein
MEFDIISFRDYLNNLLEAHPGCADYKIKIVIPSPSTFGLFTPRVIDLAHNKADEEVQPYLALVLDKYEEIKKFMELPIIIHPESQGDH